MHDNIGGYETMIISNYGNIQQIKTLENLLNQESISVEELQILAGCVLQQKRNKTSQERKEARRLMNDRAVMSRRKCWSPDASGSFMEMSNPHRVSLMDTLAPIAMIVPTVATVAIVAIVSSYWSDILASLAI